MISNSDVLSCIFHFLNSDDLIRVSRVCKKWYAISRDEPAWEYRIGFDLLFPSPTWYNYTMYIFQKKLRKKLGLKESGKNLFTVKYFDLSGNKLASVPPELGKLSNLESLHLECNQLDDIPPEVGNLINLTLLRLQNNQLTSIPSEFGNLANLMELLSRHNQYLIIPPELSHLNIVI